MLEVLVGGLLLLGLFGWFYMLEIDGDRHTIFVVLVAVFLFEAIIAGGGASVPAGILRPQFGGQDFRPPDLVIVAAMGAHLLAGRIGRIGPLTFAWFPFVAIYVAGAAIGMLNRQPVEIVLFEAKALFYIVGGAMIASGVDSERLMDSASRVGAWFAPTVPLALAVRILGLQLTVNTPVQRLDSLGAISNDTITVLVALGAIVSVAESVRSTPSYWRLGAGYVLLLAPLAGQQRASYLSLVASLVVLALIVSGRTWRERSTVRPTQLLLVVVGMTAVMLVGLLSTDSPGVVSLVDDAFGGVANENSAAARITLYEATIAEIGKQPVIGSGLGSLVTTEVEVGEVTASSHNLILDVLLRVGAFGLVAFVIAIAVTVVVAVRVWRWSPSSLTAAVGASVLLVLAAVLAKAMVEPVLQKFRLSLLLGMALGCLAAAERTIPWSETRIRFASTDSPLRDIETAVKRRE